MRNKASKIAGVGLVILATFPFIYRTAYNYSVNREEIRIFNKFLHSEPVRDFISSKERTNTIQSKDIDSATLEALMEANQEVSEFLDYELTEVPFESINERKGCCKEYTLLTLASFLDRVNKSRFPEAKERIRCVIGKRDRLDHSWLEVKIKGRWEMFETTGEFLDITISYPKPYERAIGNYEPKNYFESH